MPDALREYALNASNGSATGYDLAVGAFAAVWGVGCLVASFGVFALMNRARAACLAAVAMGVALQGLLEPSITTAWSETAQSAAEVLAGIVVGLLYFLPLETKASSRPRSK